MTPQTVNAVNLPLQNALNFPAAILQPPYSIPGRRRDQLRAIGAVIGHEISQLRRCGQPVRCPGRLNNWWTKDDFAHFKAASEKLAAQCDVQTLPDLTVNGHQTLGENIADVAGCLPSTHSRCRSEAAGAVGRVSPAISSSSSASPELAHEGREAAAQQVVTDGHAPAHTAPTPPEPRCVARGVSGQTGPEANCALRPRPRVVIGVR